jgi:uncharacterized membrane protein
MPRIGLERLRELLRATFWLVPAMCVIAAIALAVGLLAFDQQLGPTHGVFLFPGSPSTARSFLSSIIQAMITFTGLVFTITIVVLQLTSAQFSPRVLRTFLRDRTIRFSLGIFLATFVYAMVALRGVGGSGSGGVQVPRVSLTVALVLVLVSVGTFIRYVAHIVNMIRAASIIGSIGSEARAHLELHFPADALPARTVALGRPVQDIVSPSAAVLVAVNGDAIVRAAASADAVVVLAPRVGDYCPAGTVLMQVHRNLTSDRGTTEPPRTRMNPERLLEGVSFDTERTLGQDLPFAFRQLVDIAQKGLSPGVNDPTTAVQAIDVIHDLLRRLCTRHLSGGCYADSDDVIRLVVPQLSFEGYLGLAVGQIWNYAQDAVQVPQRLAQMLADLERVALPEYRGAIDRYLVKVKAEADKDPTSDTTVSCVRGLGSPGSLKHPS